MATRKRNSEDHSQVKALNPRDADVQHYGDEPLFVLQPDEDKRRVALMVKKMPKNYFPNI